MPSLQIFDGEYQHGNKPISQSGSGRLRGFAQWAIDRPEKFIVVTGISIVYVSLSRSLGVAYDGVLMVNVNRNDAGHSGWFKCFFKAFLPAKFEHECKKKKIQNCGVIGFTLVSVKEAQGKDDELFRIIPDSLTTIYKGYSK